MKSLKKGLGMAVPVIAGAIGAKVVKNLSGKVTQNNMLRAALPLAVGLFLASGKGKTLPNVGLGMIAVGGADLVGSVVPALNGIEDADLSGIFDDLSGSVINDRVLADDMGDDMGDDLSGASDENY